MNPEFSGSRSQFKDYENVLIVKKTFYECLVRPSSIHHWIGSEKSDLSGNWFGSKWRVRWTIFQLDGLEHYKAKKCDSIVIEVWVFKD